MPGSYSDSALTLLLLRRNLCKKIESFAHSIIILRGLPINILGSFEVVQKSFLLLREVH